jgi:hypothetical protein
MKLTATQLKKIIAEEVKKAIIKEGPSDSPEVFYSKKADLLSSALKQLDAAMDTLSIVSDLDEMSPEGEDTDIRSAMMDLTSVREFVEGIHSAVEAMVK